MFKLDENYFLRKCFFERRQVPTQTVMKKKMTEALANVYFKDMTPKLKVLAGLEPPLRGGGSDWFVPPHDILKGEVKLKPIKKEYLSKLGFTGIDHLGEMLVHNHHRRLELQKRLALAENDKNWKINVTTVCQKVKDDTSKQEAQYNTEELKLAFIQFENLYATSLTRIETVIFDAAIKAIEEIRQDAFIKMKLYYEDALKRQATSLYEKYIRLLRKEKERKKRRFIRNVGKKRKRTWDTVHNINIEKHKVIEKLRNFLEYQNLACQIYVALNEREVCDSEINSIKTRHKKRINKISDEIALTNYEILLLKEKERNRRGYNRVWQIKVCHVVRRFQEFVSYCLNLLPDHAEFFINMEKLMLLQLNEAMDNPSCESIIVQEEEPAAEPVPQPKPFIIFGDFNPKTYETDCICDDNVCRTCLCSSNTKDIPIFMINKRYIYAACDNIQTFSKKFSEFIVGHKDNDPDIKDDYDYSYSMPVKFDASHQLKELKLESSLMQVLQNEIPNVKNVPTDCCICKVKHCFCSPLQFSTSSHSGKKVKHHKHLEKKIIIPVGKKIESRDEELKHEREPKADSYAAYVKPRRCKCPKRAKKQLEDHMPRYMYNTSPFDTPEIANYEQCSVNTLRRLVEKYRGETSVKEPPTDVMKTREIGTQYSDLVFDHLCTCFADEEIENLYQDIMRGSKMFAVELNQNRFNILGSSMSHTHLTKSTRSFATDRALELRELLDIDPDLEELFKKSDCNF